MSKLKVSGNASGTGVITLEAPNTNTDRAITLPDAAGELINIAPSTSGNVLTSDGTDWTSAAAAAGGKVLQVVQGTTSTEVSTSATTWIDGGLSASITPSSTSSKILVSFAANIRVGTGADIQGGLRLVRGASTVIQNYGNNVFGVYDAGENPLFYGSFMGTYLDSPSTTSATTYKYQGRNYSDGTFYMNSQAITSIMILMEIGA